MNRSSTISLSLVRITVSYEMRVLLFYYSTSVESERVVFGVPRSSEGRNCLDLLVIHLTSKLELYAVNERSTRTTRDQIEIWRKTEDSRRKR